MNNQLFHYHNTYPLNLPQIDSEKYNMHRIESSDIQISPKMSIRNMPLFSDGHRNLIKQGSHQAIQVM